MRGRAAATWMTSLLLLASQAAVQAQSQPVPAPGQTLDQPPDAPPPDQPPTSQAPPSDPLPASEASSPDQAPAPDAAPLGPQPSTEAPSLEGEPGPEPATPQVASPEAQTSEVAATDPVPASDQAARPVDEPSTDAWHVINWVIASHDNNDMPFMVIDKIAAELFLFDSSGQKIGASPALVGMTAGDEVTPGVGDRELANIPPKDRKTPAGRFVAKFGRAAGGRDVLWVDYPSAISLHAVVSIRNQHRPERLRSPTPDDNRITYGCINVPSDFYATVVKPLFKASSGIVYILPETKALNEVFLAMPPPLDGPPTPQAAQ